MDGLPNKETGRKARGRRWVAEIAVEIVVEIVEAHDHRDSATLLRTSISKNLS